MKSGSKYQTEHGVIAIKDGIKCSDNPSTSALAKPEWLKIKVQDSPKYQALKTQVTKHKLATVCQEAKCPKTSLMLGLGETDAEILEAMQDIRTAKVDILTLGQYLQPTQNHLPVMRYVSPQQFDSFREQGLQMGFYEVAAGPLVRSSYRADKVFARQKLSTP
jgi:lipoate synthase